MATKRNHSAAKVLQKKADDAVVYQVMVALVLLCCALLGLRALRSYYATVGGFTAYGVTVTSGLADGDMVITAGAQKVSEGMRVKHTK